MVSLSVCPCLEVLSGIVRRLFALAFSSQCNHASRQQNAPDATVVHPHLIDISLYFLEKISTRPHTKIRRRFVERLVRESGVSRQAFVLGLYYMMKIMTRKESQSLGKLCKAHSQKLSSEKVLLMSLVAAGKVLYDDGDEMQVYNQEWADISGCYSLAAVNAMEHSFMEALDWNVNVTLKDYNEFVDQLNALQREQTRMLCNVLPLSYATLGWLESILLATYHDMVNSFAQQGTYTASFNAPFDVMYSPNLFCACLCLFSGNASSHLPPAFASTLGVATPLQAAVFGSMVALCSVVMYCASLVALHTACCALQHLAPLSLDLSTGVPGQMEMPGASCVSVIG